MERIHNNTYTLTPYKEHVYIIKTTCPPRNFNIIRIMKEAKEGLFNPKTGPVMETQNKGLKPEPERRAQRSAWPPWDNPRTECGQQDNVKGQLTQFSR